MDEANKEQAERCGALALQAGQVGDFDKARRMLERAERMDAGNPRWGAIKAKLAHLERMARGGGDEDDDEPSPVGGPAGGASSGSRAAPSPGGDGSGGFTSDGVRRRAAAAAAAADASSASPDPSPRQTAGASSAPRASASSSAPASKTASAARAGVAGSSASAPAPAPTRPYTPEQVTMVQQIKRAKDYYAVLGLERNATAEDVKKAYRKMALKLHPDKNAAPGADEAFKRVNAAFTILSDDGKRQDYDRFGEAGANGNAADGETGRAHYQQRYEEGISPEDIFNMFFGFGGPGMGMGGGGVHTVFRGPDGRMYRGVPPGFAHGGRARAARAARAAQQEEEGEEAPFLSRIMPLLVQLLPILLILFMSFSSFTSSSDPVFSVHRNPPFSLERATRSHGVTQGLPYFVKHDFDLQVRQGKLRLHQVEYQVEKELYASWQRGCKEERAKQAYIAEQIKRASADKRDYWIATYKNFVDSNCQLFAKHFEGAGPASQ